MNTEPWSVLPNAAHINKVIYSAWRYPKAWVAARERRMDIVGADLDNLSEAVERAVREATQDTPRRAMLYHARDLIFANFDLKPLYPEQVIKLDELHNAWAAASDATDALIAWDSSADLLHTQGLLDTLEDPSPLRIHQAFLLLPYHLVKESI